MINISDLVEDVKDIHPRNKRAIGERLGCMVLDKEYERFVAPYESPRLAEASLQGRQLVLRFEGRFNRLVSSTRDIVGLSVTEGGRTSVAVKAKLEGRNLIIPVKGFKWPVQVSYCFDDATFLDGQYTAFGKVVEGMEYVDMIKKGNPQMNGSVTNPDVIVKMQVAADVTD